MKRSCDPAELGATGVFLASDGAAATTGQVIYVDGGYQQWACDRVLVPTPALDRTSKNPSKIAITSMSTKTLTHDCAYLARVDETRGREGA